MALKQKENYNKIIKSDLFLIGETLVDIYIDYQGNQHILFGGSPANICVNTKQLGLNPILCSSIGNDHHGQFLQSKLNEYHINQAFITQCKGSTSTVKMNQTSASPIPLFKRGCDYQISLSSQMIQAVKDAKIFHFSFWPLTKEPAKTTVLELIKVAKENHTIVSFDPNIHKDLIGDDSISQDELMRILKAVDIIKPSLDDLERLFKQHLSKADYMSKLETFDIDLIMMTLGKDGVYVSYNKQRTLYPTKTKTVIDSTGAGDAFWAGFYAGYLNHYSIKDSINLAQTASAFALKQIGTIIDFPDVENLNKLIKNYN